MSENALKHFFCLTDKFYFRSCEWHEDPDKGIVSVCEICSKPTAEVPHYYANLKKMHENASGPKTVQGKARSALNNYKTGNTAKHYHLLAPALRGRFPECSGCEYYEPCGSDFKYCPVLIEPMIRYVQAFEEGRIDELKQFVSLTHARVFQILNMAVQDIFEKGTLNPKVVKTYIERDDEGLPVSKETTLEWQGNPNLKRIPELMTVLGHTAQQQVMTPEKSNDQKKADGFLEMEKDRTRTIADFEERRTKALEELKNKLTAAAEKRREDEILSEFENLTNETPGKS